MSEHISFDMEISISHDREQTLLKLFPNIAHVDFIAARELLYDIERYKRGIAQKSINVMLVSYRSNFRMYIYAIWARVTPPGIFRTPKSVLIYISSSYPEFFAKIIPHYSGGLTAEFAATIIAYNSLSLTFMQLELLGNALADCIRLTNGRSNSTNGQSHLTNVTPTETTIDVERNENLTAYVRHGN